MRFSEFVLIFLIVITILPIGLADAASEVAPQQEWSMTYGPYTGRAVIQTSDGGYAVAGANATFDYRGVTGYWPLLIKTDSKGALQWRKTYEPADGVNDGYAHSLVQTNDSGYALCGDGWLLKTDAQGNRQWNKTLNTGIENGPTYKTRLLYWSIIKINNAGFVLTGTGNFDNGSGFGYLVKTDENGNVIWNKIFSASPRNVAAFQAVQTNDGGYAIAGSWNDEGWLARTDPDGNLVLNQTYEAETLSSIIKTADGGFLLASDQRNLRKVDSSGNLLWKHYYKPYSSSLKSVAQVPDGGFLAGGLLYKSNNGYASLIRTDASGNLLWNGTYGGKIEDEARSIANTNDGGFVVAGTINESVWLAKFSMEQTPTPTPSIPEFQPWSATVASVIALLAIGIAYRMKTWKKPRNT